MVEHCDKCGTELHEEQARHQRYHVEDAKESSKVTDGHLCADCYHDFREWLDAPEV